MSIELHHRRSGHPNIHHDNSLRELDVYYSEPADGPNDETGVLLLIPGFGGHANANVYRKMRRTFSDKYNLMVVQCDYFGNEFMQTPAADHQLTVSSESLKLIDDEQDLQDASRNGYDMNLAMQLAEHKNMDLLVKCQLNETIEHFNEMGIMQAIDNLTALFDVIKVVKEKGVQINSKKIIVYGHSHGAYLSYMCNALVPELFTLLIDNSAWCFPQYLNMPRVLSQTKGKINLIMEMKYLAASMDVDRELLELNKLYRRTNNSCRIVSYHGADDILVSSEEKKAFCASVPNCEYHEITRDAVDGEIVRSAAHGLDANFLLLFDYVMKDRHFDISYEWKYGPHKIATNKHVYCIDFDDDIPLLTVQ
ncbi:DUF2920 family protein [Paenibacillus spongiae]|uniref:DUF2920 family protein n=1 Tax=Paenibacillus spongiae TaxID=2909671 RepID=A0ABY5S7I9_9BACL|nr:DUF2920 family protein [Paenibacillus spongiae]UVI29881.1 DUF2920 family protein [Paenibacillus spongiae]